MKEKIKGESHIGISGNAIQTFCTSNYIQEGNCKTLALVISALVFFLNFFQEEYTFFALHTHPDFFKNKMI